jgi:putative heme-binding domain-containing protein
VELLARAKPEAAGHWLPDLLRPQQPVPLQRAAARSLAVVADPDLATRALHDWARYTVGTRQELLGATSRSGGLGSALLKALERREILAVELDPVTRENLRQIRDPGLQARLGKLLGTPARDRAVVVARYRQALRQLEAAGQKGDPLAGARLFAGNCLACHQTQGQGHRVGPDLAGIGNRPTEALIEDLLDPSKEVAPDFRDFILVTRDGRQLSGLLAAETASSVTLRRAEGVEDTVLRTEIEDLRTTGKSLMPEGLEQVLRPQDVADLLAFLRRGDAVPLPPARR